MLILFRHFHLEQIARAKISLFTITYSTLILNFIVNKIQQPPALLLITCFGIKTSQYTTVYSCILLAPHFFVTTDLSKLENFMRLHSCMKSIPSSRFDDLKECMFLQGCVRTCNRACIEAFPILIKKDISVACFLYTCVHRQHQTPPVQPGTNWPTDRYQSATRPLGTTAVVDRVVKSLTQLNIGT